VIGVVRRGELCEHDILHFSGNVGKLGEEKIRPQEKKAIPPPAELNVVQTDHTFLKSRKEGKGEFF
jgi:hypothetical protein